MEKLFCDKCKKEITDVEKENCYYVIHIRKSYMTSTGGASEEWDIHFHPACFNQLIYFLDKDL